MLELLLKNHNSSIIERSMSLLLAGGAYVNSPSSPAHRL